jgi:uncharacterized protein (TIGR02301 family)
MMRRFAVVLLAALLLAGHSGSGVIAQSKPAKPPVAPPPPAPAPAPTSEPPPPPYEPQMLRLAEIMGSLSFLRDLCGQKDGEAWRAKMAALLEVEAKTEKRKEILAGDFNHGFRGYEMTYRTCTPAARLVIARYLDEGARLAHELTNRFGGG